MLRVKLPARRRAGSKGVAPTPTVTRRLFADAGLVGTVGLPEAVPGRGHTFNQYVIRVPKRDALRAFLVGAGHRSGRLLPVAAAPSALFPISATTGANFRCPSRRARGSGAARLPGTHGRANSTRSSPRSRSSTAPDARSAGHQPLPRARRGAATRCGRWSGCRRCPTASCFSCVRRQDKGAAESNSVEGRRVIRLSSARPGPPDCCGRPPLVCRSRRACTTAAEARRVRCRDGAEILAGCGRCPDGAVCVGRRSCLCCRTRRCRSCSMPSTRWGSTSTAPPTSSPFWMAAVVSKRGGAVPAARAVVEPVGAADRGSFRTGSRGVVGS